MDEGAGVPAVTLTGADGPIALAEVGGGLVIYFYPRDDTSGCTREAQDFSALARDFEAAGVQVAGVSRGSAASSTARQACATVSISARAPP